MARIFINNPRDIRSRYKYLVELTLGSLLTDPVAQRIVTMEARQIVGRCEKEWQKK